MRRIFPLLVALLLLVPSASHALPAFPGAEGWGSDTIGGRSASAKLCKVNTLSDGTSGSCSGNICSGTLRYCLDRNYVTGPKFVIFTVGGTITLTEAAGGSIDIREPNVTVAGQTAPGGGILIRGPGRETNQNGWSMIIHKPDIIIRGLRIRDHGKSALSAVGSRTGQGIVHNVILDHNSLSWSLDTISEIFYDTHHVTLSYNILSEARHDAIPGEGSEANLISTAGGGNCDVNVYDISLHHNLYAHSVGRNPLVAHDVGRIELINNVVYDWGHVGFDFRSIIGAYAAKNVLIRGPSYPLYSYTSPRGIRIYNSGNCQSIPNNTYMMSHNIGPDRPLDDATDEWEAVDGGTSSYRTNTPPFTLWGNTEDDVMTVKAKVLANAGAIVPYRDAVDNRIINDVWNVTGGFIAHPDQVGGWPTIAPGSYPTDTDGDGMPDAWETARGLNPSNKNDWNSYDVDPNYMNIEVYINSFFLESDTTPPVRYDSTPGSLPSGTTQYNVTLTTTDDSGGANCRIGTVPLVAYADMTNDFDTTGGTSHSELVTGLSDGNTYNYYVRCQDLADPPNANPDDYLISFMVQNPSAAGGSFSGQGTFQ